MILYSQWLGTKLSTRQQIAKTFGIAKIRATHVSNDQIVDDGYNVKDIENALNKTVLQGHLNSKETDIDVLYGMLVQSIENPQPVKLEVKSETEEKPVKVAKKAAKKK